MAGETASLLIDLLFAATGVSVVLVQLLRRRVPPPAQSAGRSGLLELALTAAGLVAAAVGPNILVVATASGILDAVRLSGFHLGLMPGNMPRMFGVMILDRMAEGPTLGSDLVGYLYHYWVGACFGLTYTLLAGRPRWWGGVIWGLVIEIGMMVTPPMVIAMDTGYFGSKVGPGLFFTSLTAHVAFGIALGLLAERFVHHKGSIFTIAAETLRAASGQSGARRA